MDVKVEVGGTCVSTPTIGRDVYTFQMEASNKGGIEEFTVYVQKTPEEAVDIHKGDRVFIRDAGFYRKDEVLNLTVKKGVSLIFKVLPNNNLGVVNGENFISQLKGEK